MRRVAALPPLLLVLPLPLPTAAAFASLPPGTSPHDDITAAAADAGFPPDAVRALQQAVREPDFQDAEHDPEPDDLARTDADHEYEAGHHCDRVAPASDAQAFADTARHIGEQRRKAENESAAGETKAAIAALGRALHAIQDCYSHTNVVDLGQAAQQAHEDALVRGGDAVPGLRLVAYDPGADEPGRPEGDGYGHDDFAKDSADMNAEAKATLPDGRTKYEAARDLAKDATVAFLTDFLATRTEEQKAALMDAKPEDAGLPDDTGIPAPSLALAMAAVVVALLGRRRRSRDL